MMKKTKWWLTLASMLVVVGAIAFIAALASSGWDFSKINTAEYETNTYEIEESFSNISISTIDADVNILPSDDDKCKVVCFGKANEKHQPEVVDGTLTLTLPEASKWYERIFLFRNYAKITLYLPQNEYNELLVKVTSGDVKIEKDFYFDKVTVNSTTGDILCFASAKSLIKIDLTTGDVNLKSLTSGAIEITVTSGDIDLSSLTVDADIYVKTTTGDTEFENVCCKNIISDGGSGDVSLDDVIASEVITVERTTGDIEFERCDAAELSIKTTTGDVEGNLLSDKIFVVKTTTGNIRVPDTTAGGICKIECTTGDIHVTIE